MVATCSREERRNPCDHIRTRPCVISTPYCSLPLPLHSFRVSDVMSPVAINSKEGARNAPPGAKNSSKGGTSPIAKDDPSHFGPADIRKKGLGSTSLVRAADFHAPTEGVPLSCLANVGNPLARSSGPRYRSSHLPLASLALKSSRTAGSRMRNWN